jgi:WD40 repeat protein
MDFFKDGETLITASDDGTVQLYNTLEARHRLTHSHFVLKEM